MAQITPTLIEQTIKKCCEHMKARGLSKKTRASYEAMIRRFLFWEKDNWSLRVKDIRFDESLIAVQEGKGDKSRLVDMPRTLVSDLKVQLAYARSQFDMDRSLNRLGVYLPAGLAVKYPAYATSWEWYWAFPHWQEGQDPDEGVTRRFHVYDFDVQNAFRVTRRKWQLPEYATAHMLRHCYATFYLRNLLTKIKQSGIDIPNIYDFCREVLRKKLGHVSPQTTDIYIHLAMDRDDISDASPLDLL